MDTARLRRDKSLLEEAQNSIEDEFDNGSGSPGEGSQEQGLERSSEREDVGNVGTRSRLKSGKYNADLEVKEGANNDAKERDNLPQCSSGNEQSEDDAGLVEKQRESILTQSTSLTRTRAGVKKRTVRHIVVEENAENGNEQGGEDGGSGTMVVEGACQRDEEDSKLIPKLSDKKYREVAAEKKTGIRTSSRCPGDHEPGKKSFKGCRAPPKIETGQDFSRFKSKKLVKHPLRPNVQKMSPPDSTTTPKLEEPRAVRLNRGIKRRFPGDESDDCVPKCIRVRTIASMCGNTLQPIEDDELSTEEVLCKTVPTKKRGRPRKHVYVEELSEKEEEGEKQVPLSSLKRRMIATEGLGSQSSKRLCKNGSGTSPPSRRSPLFVCNVEGCKRKFKEEPALYAHARVHGDRAYACHYEGCNKSFSERSKLKRHFLIHTGEKPFLCLFEGCGKAFSLDFNLRSHTKTHTGDYNECPYANCDKHYCQEYKLRAHIAKVHSKSPRGTRKMATLENIQHRSHTQHVKAKAKRTNLLAAITVQSVKLKEAKEGRVHRIAELERQRRREAAELARIEQDLGKLERKQRQLKEGQKDCAIVTSLSLSGGQHEEDKGEEIAPSFSTATHTSSSGEEQSRLSNLPGTEYMAMGEAKEILMVSHKLPKTDQGASLVMASSETQLLNSQQPETIVSLTPLLWLQGTPPNQGHLAGQPGSHAYLRTQRPMSMSELRAIQNSAKPIGSSHATSGAANPGGFRMIEDSSDQHKHTTGDVLRQGESSHAGIQHLNATKVRKLEAHRKVSHEATKLKVQTDRELVRCDKGAVQSSASSSKSDKNVQIAVIGKGSIKKLEGEDTRIQKQKRTRDCHLSTADQAFVSLTPLLLSTDNRFSPTDARFLAASETLPSAMQRTIWGSQQNKQEEAVKVSYSGRNSVANEVSCSINVVSTYCTQNGGFSAEQSFEPSAAQLFTYQEQPRLVD